ncbi:lactate utilization protein C [Collibacillus ludicampi]|jgi:L-lactate dehydrogenase complex protein LldG|uniref:Lactate utilization protein C n=1 Tax=Collibacillus ludicampi TaxID=2771369 RepID=A0AAV4LGU9_9BACL|nr:lactate utilization protein [Collibacillus ludicampi]GIM46946.1 lactate utilization protein C [Collibacillus ludicampi]
MQKSQEAAFIERISRKLGRPFPKEKPEQPVRGVPSEWMPDTFDTEQACAAFIANWTALTGKAVLLTPDELSQQLQEVIGHHQAQQVIRWDDDFLEEMNIDETVRRTGAEIRSWKEGDRRELLAYAERCQVGITSADFAIGETGTLALFAGRGKGRSVSLLPPVHIAVFPIERLVPRMTYVLTYAAKHGMSSSLNFITGPSRTGDIEGDLSIGVHGPAYVYAFIVKK